MRDIEAEINHSIRDDGLLKLACSVRLEENEIEEFEKVLPQGSKFLSPTIGDGAINYSLETKYESKDEAEEKLSHRLELFEMFVRSRTELTIPCNLKLTYK